MHGWLVCGCTTHAYRRTHTQVTHLAFPLSDISNRPRTYRDRSQKPGRERGLASSIGDGSVPHQLYLRTARMWTEFHERPCKSTRTQPTRLQSLTFPPKLEPRVIDFSVRADALTRVLCGGGGASPEISIFFQLCGYICTRTHTQRRAFEWRSNQRHKMTKRVRGVRAYAHNSVARVHGKM